MTAPDPVPVQHPGLPILPVLVIRKTAGGISSKPVNLAAQEDDADKSYSDSEEEEECSTPKGREHEIPQAAWPPMPPNKPRPKKLNRATRTDFFFVPDDSEIFFPPPTKSRRSG